MAVLAISALGAGVSSALGFSASAGWLVGSLIGNLLFQKKGPNTQGPRLTDLTVQTSTEGAAIPIVYGTMRIAGNMIWTSGIKEVKTKKKQGGKGMGGSSTHTTYTYQASFAIGLCEGPIQGVRKIWADSKLIYDNSAGASAGTIYASRKKMSAINVYLGSASQTADSIIAADVGAANCPAFRGLAYLVFDRLQLADFGNRIPNITCEVVSSASAGTYLWRVNTFPQGIPTNQIGFNNGVALTLSGSFISGSDWLITFNEYDLNGNKLRTYTKKMILGGNNWNIIYAWGYPRVGYALAQAAGDVKGVFRWVYENVVTDPSASNEPYGNAYYWTAGNQVPALYLNGYLFVRPHSYAGGGGPAFNGITRYPVFAGRTIAHYANAMVDCFQEGLCTSTGGTSSPIASMSATDEGTILVRIWSGNVINYQLLEFDTNLNFIKGYNFAGITWPTQTSPMVRNGRYLVGISPTNQMYLYEEQASGVYTHIKTITMDGGNAVCQPMGNGLVWTRYGVYSIYPPLTPQAVTTGSIVSDISSRCGLTGANYDSSALNHNVWGYVISQPMTGRSAIEPLGQAYFFDAVESDYVIKYIKRPGTIRAVLEDGDLGAGIDTPANELVKRRRMQELELPVEVRVEYIDYNNDYNQGMQLARRLTTQSKHTVDIQLAIAMTSTYAAQVADITMRNVWAERDIYDFSLTREFLALDPCDLVTMPNGDNVRIVTTEYTDPNFIKMMALRDVSAAYTSVEVGNSTSHEYPQSVIVEGPTRLLLLDIPPLRDEDYLGGFYIAACGYYSGWKGCEVVRALDGVTFSEIITITTEATIGNVTSFSLPTPQYWQQFDDVGSITVDLATVGATLSSITDDELLAGGNACYAGGEIFQFGIATLNVDGTYTLTHLLRGRLGTERFMSTHVDGEDFVFLDTDIRFVEDGVSNIGVEMTYRAITLGNTLDEAEDLSFTNTGNSLKHPSAVEMAAHRNFSGTWVLEWTPRNITGWWFNSNGPNGPEYNDYRIEIYTLTGELLNTYTTTSPALNYTLVRQNADWGGNSSATSFIWKVYQVGRDSIWGHAGTHQADPASAGFYRVNTRNMRPVICWQYLFDATPDDAGPNNFDGTSSGTISVNQPDIPAFITESTSTYRSVLFTSGYLQRVDSTLFDFTTDLITMACWVKWSHSNTAQVFMSKWSSAATTSQSYRLGVGLSAGKIRGVIRRTDDSLIDVVTTVNFNDSAWHHVVFTGGRGNFYLYVDAVLRASSLGNSILPPYSTAENFRCGQNNNGSEIYVGSLAEPMLIEGHLSAQGVKNLYRCALGLEV